VGCKDKLEVGLIQKQFFDSNYLVTLVSMNIIIQSSIHTLSKSKTLLSILSNQDLCNNSVPPYNSCIGSHIRHILDFYDCILEGYSNEFIVLTNRARDTRMHEDCDYAFKNVERIINSLNQLSQINPNLTITVSDDLGLGKVDIEYTLGAILAQANSHAIHHYAIINYILESLKISIKDDTFGYNPTTPQPEINLN
jgi:hypothetical protein